MYYNYTVPQIKLPSNFFINVHFATYRSSDETIKLINGIVVVEDNGHEKMITIITNFVYNLLKNTVQKHLQSFNFCRAVVVLETLNQKGTNEQERYKFKNNTGKFDYRSMTDFYDKFKEKIRDLMDKFQQNIYIIPVEFTKIDLHIWKMNPLSGGTYKPLPKQLLQRRQSSM